MKQIETALERMIDEAIDPLEDAHSLSFSAYTNQEIYEQEVKTIFHDDWVFVCQEPELVNAGDYFAITIADEPIYVMRGNDGKLRAMSNICRHRGTVLLDEGFGKVEKYVTCPYHAWAFDLDGELKAIPYNKIIAVDREHHKLQQFHVDTWNGLVFVHLGESPVPLIERFNGMHEYLSAYRPETFTEATSGEVEYWDANWKLAMENGMESYHLFKVHTPTLETVSPTRGAYYIAGNSEWSLTGGALTYGDGMIAKMASALSKDTDKQYVLLSMAPSFVGILSGGSLGWISVHPDGPNKSKIRSGVIGRKGEVRDSKEGKAFTVAFFEEDKVICERVHKGMKAKKGRGGKLVDMERVVTDFHQYLATRLGNLPQTTFHDETKA